MTSDRSRDVGSLCQQAKPCRYAPLLRSLFRWPEGRPPAANTPKPNAEGAFMTNGRHRDELRGTAAVAVICRPAYLAAEFYPY